MLKRLLKKENKLKALNETYSKAVEIKEGTDAILLGVVDAFIRNKGRRYR